MILDEGLFNPLTPKDERGKNAWTRPTTVTSLLGKRERDAANQGETAGDSCANRRKLRRTASAKLQSQNSTLWHDIVGTGLRKQGSSTTLGNTNDALIPADNAIYYPPQDKNNSDLPFNNICTAKNVGSTLR